MRNVDATATESLYFYCLLCTSKCKHNFFYFGVLSHRITEKKTFVESIPSILKMLSPGILKIRAVSHLSENKMRKRTLKHATRQLKLKTIYTDCLNSLQ